MNTRLVNAAAGVICAAQKVDRTPAGIAFALESAQLLQSPETADELLALRAENKRLRAELAARPAEAHVLRQAANELEDDHPSAAAGLLVMANAAEHAAALRPWKTAAEAGEPA